jgi:hypothetical protein
MVICCHNFDWTLFWSGSSAISSILTTLITIGLFWFAWIQLKKIKQTTEADFYYRIKSDFFTEKSKLLMALLEYNALIFIENIKIIDDKENKYPYFKVDKTKIMAINPDMDLEVVPKMYSVNDIEDILLNQIEDLSILEEKGVLNFEEIVSGYSNYIVIIMENEGIRKYIQYAKNPRSDEISDEENYSGCEDLYTRIKNL